MCAKFHRLVCVCQLPQVVCVKFYRLVCTVHVSSSTGVDVCQVPRVAVNVSSSTGWCVYVNFHKLVCTLCICQVPQVGVRMCQLPQVAVCVHTPAAAWVLVDAASNSIPNVRAMPFYHSFCLPLSLGPQGQLCSVCEGRGVFWNTNKHQTTNCTI